MDMIQFIPKTNVNAKEQETHYVGKNGETTGKQYKLDSVDDTTMFSEYHDKENSCFNMKEIPGAENLSVKPDDIEGEKVSETKNNDGTYTITYKTATGITTVTGKKTGLLGAFGIGKISSKNYSISQYDNNGKLTSTTEKNNFGQIMTTLYDDNGNKDFAVMVGSNSNVNSDYAIENGKVAVGTSISLFDYNPNGTCFREDYEHKESGTEFLGSESKISQRYYDSDGNEITRDEYMEMNNFDN